MLEAKGLSTVEDLLAYAPFPLRGPQQREADRPARSRRDGDRHRRGALGQARRLPAAQPGHVRSHASRDASRRASCSASGSTAATWPNVLAPGQKVALYGKVEFDSYAGDLTMLHPEFEILSGDDDEGEAVAAHRAASCRSTRPPARSPRACFRTLVHRVLETHRRRFDDPLPELIRDRLRLPDRWTAHPRDALSRRRTQTCACSTPSARPAQFRLIFEEFFWLECGLALKRAQGARRSPASPSS